MTLGFFLSYYHHAVDVFAGLAVAAAAAAIGYRLTRRIGVRT